MISLLLAFVGGNKAAAGVVVALAVALALSGIGAGWQSLRLSDERAAHATDNATHAEQIAALDRKALETERSYREEENRRAQALQEVVIEANNEAAKSRADAVAAGAAADKLQKRIATLIANSRPPGNPTAPGTGPTTDPAADMLAVMFTRIDAASRGIAEFADASRIAGQACERSYHALTAPR